MPVPPGDVVGGPTTKATQKALKDLVDRLTIDEDGGLRLDGLPTLILSASVFRSIQQESERILGRGASAVLYLSGEAWGRDAGARLVAAAKGTSLESTIERLQSQSLIRGFGRLEIVSFNPETGNAVIRFHNSPFAATGGSSNRPMCQLTAGFLAGVVGAFVGEEMLVAERTCRAMGADVCEFRADRLGRLTKGV